jgi:hypothetical protein
LPEREAFSKLALPALAEAFGFKTVSILLRVLARQRIKPGKKPIFHFRSSHYARNAGISLSSN